MEKMIVSLDQAYFSFSREKEIQKFLVAFIY